MNEQEKVDKTRRKLVVATSAVGAAAGVGAALPFAASLWPSERTRAAGAPVEVDLSRISPGELAGIEWRGQPPWGFGPPEKKGPNPEKGGAPALRPPAETDQAPEDRP